MSEEARSTFFVSCPIEEMKAIHSQIVSITGETDDVKTIISSKRAMFMIDISQDEETLLRQTGLEMIKDFECEMVI